MKRSCNTITLATVLIVLAISYSLLATGCTDWERTTFQVLSASKATIEAAADDYNQKKIPQTQQTYKLLLQAGAVHNTANQSFLSYKKIKDAGANKTQLDAAIAEVNTALTQLTPIIAQIQAIRTAGNLNGIGNPPAPVNP